MNASRPSNSSLRSGAMRGLVLALLLIGSVQAAADDEPSWAALRQGGKVVLLRHAHVEIREGIGHLAPGHCDEEVNLSQRGEKQARQIGKAFRAHGVPVGEVLTSPYCRCIDTGRIAFGSATPVPYLRPPGTVSEAQAEVDQAGLMKAILTHHAPTNLVMITHDLNIAGVVLEDTVRMGEFFVVEPKGDHLDIVGSIVIGED